MRKRQRVVGRDREERKKEGRRRWRRGEKSLFCLLLFLSEEVKNEKRAQKNATLRYMIVFEQMFVSKSLH